jgi:Protein of unknown function (DUF3667)
LELEAAGDVITGAVVGRAVEPGHGEGRVVAHGTCLNCGTVLHGRHCHDCGQVARVHRTLAAIGNDILHGVFHFEGKIWRTLPKLLISPGDLTRRYVHGERARFVSPLALFLFSVFLMFAVFETVGGPIHSNRSDAERESIAMTRINEIKAENAALVQKRAAMVARNENVAAIDAKLKERQSAIEGMEQGANLMLGKAVNFKGAVKADTGSKVVDQRIQHALENPTLLLYKLQSSAYKFAWALIPLSMPFMWLMFAWRRKYKIYDHAVFVTYSLSFVMLLLVMMALVTAAGAGLNTIILLTLIPAHFFLQLKGAYSLTRLGASWRTVTLLFVAFFVLSAFGALLLVLGFMG